MQQRLLLRIAMHHTSRATARWAAPVAVLVRRRHQAAKDARHGLAGVQRRARVRDGAGKPREQVAARVHRAAKAREGDVEERPRLRVASQGSSSSSSGTRSGFGAADDARMSHTSEQPLGRTIKPLHHV